jgi:hypothetical protein
MYDPARMKHCCKRNCSNSTTHIVEYYSDFQRDVALIPVCAEHKGYWECRGEITPVDQFVYCPDNYRED